MDVHEIDRVMEAYLQNQEMAGGSLIVRKDDTVVFDKTWGYADVEHRLPVTENTIFRMASMTKVVTAVGILRLMEKGALELDAPLSKYLPEFSNMRVCADKRYEFHPGMRMASLLPKLLLFRMDKVKTVPADREITVRDLLSHASGLQQGMAGMMAMMKANKKDSLEDRIHAYSRYALDFQPGTATSYSPCAAFDILGYLMGVLTDKSPAEAYQELVFAPLEMESAVFKLPEDGKARLARTYTRKNGRLTDVTATSKDLEGILRIQKDSDYVAGCGGLYCTVHDYEKLGRMLCNRGNGYLKPETVQLMHTEAQEKHLEPEPGQVWGLGVRIRQRDEFCTPGTYGWSGALGTHFFVSPEDKLDAVFATHRTDLGGSGSYISRKVEELVFGVWKNR